MVINSLKTIDTNDDELTVANYIILFGGRDLEWARRGPNKDGSMGDFFTKNTELESAYTKSGMLHVDWEHGYGKMLDGDISPGEDDVLGYVNWKTARTDERGVWVERVLSRRNEYVKWLEELVKEGLLGTSTLPVQKGVVRADNGELKSWPLMRDTITAQPAEPKMMTENVIIAMKHLSGKLTIPTLTDLPTLAEKAKAITNNLEQLLSDTRAVAQAGPGPLNQTKRQELETLLEMLSGLDAARTDVTDLLNAASPVGMANAKALHLELADRLKQYEHLLKE